jgi:dTDP-glucose 4,6-dehydratase
MDHSGPHWPSIHMNILVTGGCGFIGSNFVTHLVDSDPSVRIVNLDKLTYAAEPTHLAPLEKTGRYRLVQGDIADRPLVASLLTESGCHAVVHFAAESHVDRSIDSAAPFFETNVMGTLALLESTRAYWRTLPPDQAATFRFLYVSTDEVYGSLAPHDPAFHEDTPFAPNSPYAASKAAGDHLVRAWHHTYGFPVLTTNCSNNYGPWQFPEKLIPLMILNALEGKPLPIYGDGLNIRDWIHVADHCRGVETVLRHGRPGQTYNIGAGCERTNLEVVDTLCTILDGLAPRPGGKPYSDLRKFVPDRPGHDRRYAVDSRKIRKELGWQPTESFESGLAKTVAWYLENRDWTNMVTRNRYQRERLGLASS